MNEETNINVEKTYTDPLTGKFVKGNPGGGRPLGSISITTEIKKKLEETPPDKKHNYLHYLIEQILKKAIIEGDIQMITKIWNYIDGMPQESHDFTTGGEKLNKEMTKEELTKIIAIYGQKNNEPKSDSSSNLPL